MNDDISAAHRARSAALALLAAGLAGALGCSDDHGPDERLGSPAIVSNPVAVSPRCRVGAALALPVAYVSFAPGTYSGASARPSATAVSPYARRPTSSPAAWIRCRSRRRRGQPGPSRSTLEASTSCASSRSCPDHGRARGPAPSRPAAARRPAQPSGSSDVQRAGESRRASTATSLQLRQAAAAVAAEVSVSEDGLIATLQPLADLQPGTEYTIAVGGGIEDSDGAPLEAPVDRVVHHRHGVGQRGRAAVRAAARRRHRRDAAPHPHRRRGRGRRRQAGDRFRRAHRPGARRQLGRRLARRRHGSRCLPHRGVPRPPRGPARRGIHPDRDGIRARRGGQRRRSTWVRDRLIAFSTFQFIPATEAAPADYDLGLFVTRADGAGSARLARELVISGADWSPDGRAIAFGSFEEGDNTIEWWEDPDKPLPPDRFPSSASTDPISGAWPREGRVPPGRRTAPGSRSPVSARTGSAPPFTS